MYSIISPSITTFKTSVIILQAQTTIRSKSARPGVYILAFLLTGAMVAEYKPSISFVEKARLCQYSAHKLCA